MKNCPKLSLEGELSPSSLISCLSIFSKSSLLIAKPAISMLSAWQSSAASAAAAYLFVAFNKAGLITAFHLYRIAVFCFNAILPMPRLRLQCGRNHGFNQTVSEGKNRKKLIWVIRLIILNTYSCLALSEITYLSDCVYFDSSHFQINSTVTQFSLCRRKKW